MDRTIAGGILLLLLGLSLMGLTQLPSYIAGNSYYMTIIMVGFMLVFGVGFVKILLGR
jgi:ABC-type transport system involved in multi-copper enzyme maturation permease subunit